MLWYSLDLCFPGLGVEPMFICEVNAISQAPSILYISMDSNILFVCVSLRSLTLAQDVLELAG